MIASIAEFYPSAKGNNPIHSVCDWAKVRKLARDARRGDSIPAIVVHEGQMLTGVHRAAANYILRQVDGCEMIPVVELGDLDIDQDTYDAVLDHLEYGAYDNIDSLIS